MKTRTHKACLLLLVCVIAVPSVATARVSFSIGIGTTFGHGYPYHGWCSDWHFYRPWYGHHYGSWCAPSIGLWIHPRPVVVHAAPIVTERHIVVERERPACPPLAVRHVSRLTPRSRYSRSELLKMLRIGDRDTRVQAARDLAAAHCDEKARLALERALLCDAEAEVRRAAAQSLDRLGDARALPSLRQAYATDASREVCQAAYRGIIMLEGY